DLPNQERVRVVDARIEDGHDRAGAVESAPPRHVGADEGHALGQQRRLYRVIEHAIDPQRSAFEFGEPGRVELQREKRDVVVMVDDSIVVFLESRQYEAAGLRDVGPLDGRRRVRETALWNVSAAGKA